MAKVQDILEIQDTRVIVRYLLVSFEKSKMSSSWYHRK